MLPRVRAVALTILAALAIVTPAAAAGAASRTRTAPDLAGARSVLVISLPATAWIDLRDQRPPNLTRLLRHSALADLATRTVRNRTLPGAGYMALGAGGRSVAAPADAAPNLQATEDYAGTRASAVFATRTARLLRLGIGALDWAQLQAQNEQTTYDTKIGSLGTALGKAGIGRFVIANADEPSPFGLVYHREAALGLANDTGRTPGRVTGITATDPGAPFGVMLDARAVDAAFPTDFATRRQVVLVEASDLARADEYRPLATPEQRAALHAQALARTDQLVGSLLRHVDLRRDAVVVVSPYHTARTRTLTVVAVHAPHGTTGLLESATTRREGFLQIVDVAPTILDLVGVEPPDSMEGRPARLHPDSGTYRERVNALVRADRGAQFRDATIGTAQAILVASTITLAVAAVLWFLYARRTRVRQLLVWASLLLIGFVTATFLAGLVPFFRYGMTDYFVFVIGVAVVFAAVCLAVGRRNPVDPILVALGIVAGMHLVDLLTGTRVQFNTVFGYSPTVGIRLAGIGNPGSAQLSMAALLFTVLITWRIARRGPAIGYAVLGVTLVVVGAPLWGQDYGGALALAPTLVLWWLLQSGRRIRLRTVLTIAAVVVVTGIVAGLLDLSRPSSERTHVGRFFEQIGQQGPAGFFDVIGRKWSLMVETFSNTAWVLVVLVVLAVVVLAFRRTDVMRRIFAAVPTMGPGLVCAAVLTLLATGLNDSGVQVTGMMFATALPVLVFLAARFSDGDEVVDDAPSPPVTDDRVAVPG
jgi:hypothetical protein